MGRGRAKAKQTKVARELKYRTMDTDFTSLERELRGSSEDEHHHEVIEVPDPDPDPYADLAGKYDVEDDDDAAGYRRSG